MSPPQRPGTRWTTAALSALPWGVAAACALLGAEIEMAGHSAPGTVWETRAAIGTASAIGALLSVGLSALLGRRRLLALIPGSLAALWCLPLAAHAPSPTPGPAAAPGPDIVLITLDTLRDDHVDTDGGPPTPHLAAFARTARRYRQAVTASPLTLPSHSTLLTGASPEDLEVTSNRHRLTTPTIADTLAEAGWQTGGFVGARVLARESGIASGFQRFDDRWGDDRWSWLWHGTPSARERRGDRVVQAAVQWLADTPGRRFLWVHLYDPHSPYGGPDSPTRRVALTPEIRAEMEAAGSLIASIDVMEKAKRPPLLDAYDDGVTWTDRALGPLLEAIPEDALVVVAADHGEGLGEHEAWFTHGARLHEPVMQVPLLVRWPGRLSAGSDEPGLVGLIDIHPLLLHVAGLSPDPGPLLSPPPGRGLAMFTSGERAGHTLKDAPGGPKAGTRWDREKLVADAAGRVSWTDLADDPSESSTSPIPPHRAGEAEQVRSRASRAATPSMRWDVSQLEALGYVDP